MNAPTARLFVAIDPPAEIREMLAPLCGGLPGSKWTRPGQLHVTLRFLGAVPEDAVTGIGARLRGTDFPAFDLVGRGFGVFPSFRSPRVLWIGLSPAAPLEALHDEIERRLEGAAAPDERRLSPHLTIARLDGTPPEAVRDWIGARARFETPPWNVKAFSLYASTLMPSGAIHRQLGSYPALRPGSGTGLSSAPMPAPLPAAESLASRARAAIAVLDLTSLRAEDTPATVAALCRRAVEPWPGSPSAAAVCILPRLVAAARRELSGTRVCIASVAGDFPSGRAPLAEKIEEVRRAVGDGADEIDAPIDRRAFARGDDRRVAEEIAAIREACPASTLKVILETGELGSEQNIRRAAGIALEAGADFVKSSTGTIPAGATLDSIRVLLEAARDAEIRLGRRVGVKASGGIRRREEAFAYIDLARRIRGPEGSHPGRFRIGASSLLDDLVALSREDAR